MNKELSKKFLIFLLGTLLISSCSSSNSNDEFDLSDLKLPVKKTLTKDDLSDEIKAEKKEVQNNLIPLEKREEILKSVKFGKKNPFSSNEQENNLKLLNLKLTGFLLINEKKYALLNYVNKSGAVTSDSIGGINTDLLPEGAKIREINLNKQVLIIEINNKTFEITLDQS